LEARIMSSREIVLGKVHTPIGEFGAVLTAKGLTRLTFPTEQLEECEAWADRWEPDAHRSTDEARLHALGEQLTAYFQGTLRDFDIELDLRGTPFQVQVWNALRDVRYGETRTYSQVAAAIGRPEAVRAVGAANGANPVPIIVPCHRIIGSSGQLVGYGGGLDMKRRLLEREGVLWAFATPS
jgi:O-6-methylguanine DNA methyltransferase